MTLGPGVGQVSPDGEFQVPGQNPDTSNLNDVLVTLRQCLGAPYRYWNDGGDGKHNKTVADVQRNGESCSGLFVFAFLKNGIDPPFAGTYDAEQTLRKQDGQPFDPNKEYPVGTFIVGVAPGTEGHMMMVSGSGNTVIESSVMDGVNEGKNARDVANPGYNIDNAVAGTFPNIGGTVSRGPGDGGLLSEIAEGVAQGIAKAFVRIFRIIYALTVLWPLDFAGGFWWELTKRLAGYVAEFTQKIDLLAILKGEDTEIPEVPRPSQGGVFSEENVNRFYWLAFLILTYQIAFGFDRNNNSHIDNVLNSGDRVGLGLNKGERGYNESASITATVSRRVTGNKAEEATSDDKLEKGSKTSGRRTPPRNGAGRFTAGSGAKNSLGQGKEAGAARRTEATRKQA